MTSFRGSDCLGHIAAPGVADSEIVFHYDHHDHDTCNTYELARRTKRTET